MKNLLAILWLGASLGAPAGFAQETNLPVVWKLANRAQVDGRGLFLADVVANSAALGLPHVLISPAPPFGGTAWLTREQISNAVARVDAALAPTAWEGAEKTSITRKTRQLAEAELCELLAETLQRQSVKDRGELELRFTRAWPAVSVPDEALTLKVLELPLAGVTPSFIARFEIVAGKESVGAWQVPAQAKVMREVLVARENLKRGQAFTETDAVLERRDVLTLRDSLAELPKAGATLELAENINAGMPLTSRTLKLRAVVRRGRTVDALLQDGGMSIVVKAEALEDGAPGQIIKVRNLNSKREFRGKVQNEDTIQVAL